MNTDWSTLSIRKALESSVSFLVEFVKKHWIIVALYVVTATLTGVILNGSQPWEISLEQRLQLGGVSLASIVVSYLLLYYGVSMALSLLDPNSQVFKKSMPKALWQIFCAGLIIGFAAIPLFLLFVIPVIWWIVKCSVATANLLSTNDGVIASIKKSHSLMNGRFWQCFGFLVGTTFIVGFITAIAMGSIGLILFFAGMFHSASAGAPDVGRVSSLFRFITAGVSVFSTIIFCYLHAWLYVYLKNNQAGDISTAA